MKVLVTGATGMVGRKLCLRLLELGHELVVLGRSDEKKIRTHFSLPCEYLSWDQLKRFHLNKKVISAPDVVIHLAGESIATGSWSKRKKERIYNSRVETTRNLVNFLIKNKLTPKSFISASAIGYYGDGGQEVIKDGDSSGSGFLAEVCRDWESASQKISEFSRLVHVRIGLVFDHRGGFLEEMSGVFNKAVGGVIGSGSQWMSWVHIEDLVELFVFAINNKAVEGAFNAVAPEPVTNKSWTKEFSKALKVPAPFFVPKLVLKLALGEKAILALQSQRVIPTKIKDLGYEFKFPKLSHALKDLYSWKKTCTDKLFYTEQWVKKDIESTFDFFSEAGNLEKITPPLLNFKILDMSTGKIRKGTFINYKLKIHGVPAKWTTLINQWDPPHMFIDNQEKGPYEKWHHTHSFSKLAGGTILTDEVIYRLPLGFLGSLVASRFVLKDVKGIFSYRQEIIAKKFDT